jgi:hypothetical protein
MKPATRVRGFAAVGELDAEPKHVVEQCLLSAGAPCAVTVRPEQQRSAVQVPLTRRRDRA